MNNLKIRQAIENNRLKYYEVAAACGVSSSTFSVWLRNELPSDKEQFVMKSIDNIISKMHCCGQFGGLSTMDEMVICFYNTFSSEISHVETKERKNEILSRMEEAFREAVRSKPSIRNEISKAYQELKIRCENAKAINEEDASIP